jgi:multiple sugar transport system substrate-binding protein
MKKLSIFVIAFLAVFALSACGGEEDSKVIEWINWDSGNRAIYEEIVAEFEKNSEYTIELTYPADYWAKVQTRVQGGDAPDLITLGFPEFKDYASQGALADISDLLSDGVVDRFDEGNLNAYKFDGKIMALPKDYNTYVVYYNEDLVINAIANDGTLKTPEQYIAAGEWTKDNFEKLAAGINALDGISGIALEQGRYKAWLPQFGADWINETTGNLNINTPEMAASLEWQRSIIKGEQYGALDQEALTTQSAGDRFKAGTLGMYVTGGWMTPQFVESGVNFNKARLPLFDDEPGYTWVDSVGLGVSASSEVKEGAVEFLEFFTDVFAQKKLAALAIPANQSEEVKQEYRTVFEGINNSEQLYYNQYPIYVFNNWGSNWNVLNTELDSFWNGTSTAAEVLSSANNKLDND